jgi:hypothetical protein
MLTLQIMLNVWDDGGVTVSCIDGLAESESGMPGIYGKSVDLAKALEVVREVVEDHERDRAGCGLEPLPWLEATVGLPEAKAGLGGWWAVKGLTKIPVTPGKELAMRPYLCDEAVGIVANWASRVGKYAAEHHGYKPCQFAVESLLTGQGREAPEWAGDDEVVVEVAQVRTALTDLYRHAWGRTPTKQECCILVNAVTNLPGFRWLVGGRRVRGRK